MLVCLYMSAGHERRGSIPHSVIMVWHALFVLYLYALICGASHSSVQVQGQFFTH